MIFLCASFAKTDYLNRYQSMQNPSSESPASPAMLSD
jgi:hypothetical protein